MMFWDCSGTVFPIEDQAVAMEFCRILRNAELVEDAIPMKVNFGMAEMSFRQRGRPKAWVYKFWATHSRGTVMTIGARYYQVPGMDEFISRFKAWHPTFDWCGDGPKEALPWPAKRAVGVDE